MATTHNMLANDSFQRMVTTQKLRIRHCWVRNLNPGAFYKTSSPSLQPTDAVLSRISPSIYGSSGGSNSQHVNMLANDTFQRMVTSQKLRIRHFWVRNLNPGAFYKTKFRFSKNTTKFEKIAHLNLMFNFWHSKNMWTL